MAAMESHGPAFDFKAKLILYNVEDGSWTFVHLPKALSALLKSHFGAQRRGFGSIRVRVTVGKTQWLTSVFPSKELQTYVLPVKAAVRKAEGLQLGRSAAYRIEPQV
jgi:hypothetical protein